MFMRGKIDQGDVTTANRHMSNTDSYNFIIKTLKRTKDRVTPETTVVGSITS